MGQILDSVMCVKEAEERFIVIYNKLIDNKEVDIQSIHKSSQEGIESSQESCCCRGQAGQLDKQGPRQEAQQGGNGGEFPRRVAREVRQQEEAKRSELIFEKKIEP